MKFLKPFFFQQRLVLNLAHVVPEDVIFILKHAGKIFLLLFVYDIVNIMYINQQDAQNSCD